MILVRKTRWDRRVPPFLRPAAGGEPPTTPTWRSPQIDELPSTSAAEVNRS